MHRMRPVACLASLLALAACSDPTSTTAPRASEAVAAAVRAAPDTALGAGSARFELTMAIESPEGRLEIVSTGGFDGDRMTVTLDFGSGLAELAERAGEPLPAGFVEPMRRVVDGDLTYLRLPMLDEAMGRGRWFSATPQELARSGSSFADPDRADDPLGLLELLRDIGDGDLREVGAEDARGVPTTHLQATVRLDEAAGHVPALLRNGPAAAQDGAAGGEVPVDVWVDTDLLVRRVTLDLGAVGWETVDHDTSVRVTLELFDHGEEIDIALPDAREVTSFSQVMDGLAGFG